MPKTSRELFDDFIKTEWQDIFRHEVHVTRDSGNRYVPNGGVRGVKLLREDTNAWDEALRLWSAEDSVPEASTPGYDLIIDKAGIEYTWEGFLIDETRPWSADVPADMRARIKADLDRRDAESRVRADARHEEDERLASLEDSRVIENMNARRSEQGKSPLTADQEAGIRERRREKRLGA